MAISNKEKKYIVKVPVYTSKRYLRNEAEDLFGCISYNALIDGVKTKCLAVQDLIIPNRNKLKETVISDVTVVDVQIGKEPGLLLNISVYDRNLRSRHVEDESKSIQFKDSTKLCSNNNYVLVYPVIDGINSAEYVCSFLFLMYDDPTKETGEVAKLGKHLLNKVLGYCIENIKLPEVLKAIREQKTIPELRIDFKSLDSNPDTTNATLEKYCVFDQIQKRRTQKFEGVPQDMVEEILNEKFDIKEYKSREVKITIGKKDFHVTREYIEALADFKDTAERVCNESFAVTEEETNNKIHTQEFIVEKLSPIISNYLSTSTE